MEEEEKKKDTHLFYWLDPNPLGHVCTSLDERVCLLGYSENHPPPGLKMTSTILLSLAIGYEGISTSEKPIFVLKMLKI